MGDEQYPGLEVDEDMRVKRWSWTGEVIEYLLLAAVILAALLGLFGSGPLSWTIQGSGTIRVEYDRFQRNMKPTTFRVETSVDSRRPAIRVDRGVLREWEVESISPEPSSTRVTGREIIYTFTAEDARRLQVVFRLIPERLGSRTIRFSSGTDVLAADVFVYP